MVLPSRKTMPTLPEQIPGNHPGPDSYPSEDDYEDDLISSYSLQSSTHDLVFENGRYYEPYRYGSHPFPRLDGLARQNERELHTMLLYLLDNELFRSTIQQPKNILDVRCGQGLWAEDVSEKFPDTEVWGMDTTSRDTSVLQNCHFILQNFNDDWVLDEAMMMGKFDFIYGRHLFASSSNFEHFYQQVLEHLEPGGYFEQVEVEIVARCDDGTGKADSVIPVLADVTPELSRSFGTDYNIANIMKTMIEQAGFVDVQETRQKLPLGPWSDHPGYRRVGELFERFYKSGIQGWLMAPMTRSQNHTSDEVNDFCRRAFEEIDKRDQHWYFTSVLVTARKPT